MTKLIRVKVHPRAKRDRVEAIGAQSFEIWTTAPADRGKANEAVRRMLAESLGLAPARLSLVRGHAAREKYFAVLD